MQVEVILFGQLSEIAGSNTVVINDVSNTGELVKAVNKLYPAIVGIKYMVAVDKKAVHDNIVLNENNKVALLPPFSGG